jgi:hypothetical protein
LTDTWLNRSGMCLGLYCGLRSGPNVGWVYGTATVAAVGTYGARSVVGGAEVGEWRAAMSHKSYLYK